VHLAVLWALGVAQPLFGVLADDPAFFVARGNTASDILIFAFVLVLLPPTLMVAVEALFVRLPAVRSALHVAFVGLLAAVLALQILGDLAPRGKSVLLIPLALACGAGAAFAYARTRFVPSMLSVLGPAPVVILALFLLFSDVSKLVLPEDGQTAAAAVGGDTPVTFVLLDEAAGLHLLDPSGGIDAERYPNFAALARDATWYPNATTVSDQTSRASPAILTGRLPRGDKLPIASDYPDNLFTLLGRSYDLHVSESASHLCPNSLCERRREAASTRLRSLARDLRIVSLRGLLPDDLANDLPAVNRTFGNFEGEVNIVSGAVIGGDQGAPQARGRAFEGFTRGIRKTKDGRSLNYVHALLPHIPWLFLSTGQLYSEHGRKIPGFDEPEESWRDEPWATRQAFARYLVQLQYVDRLIGGVMDRLRAEGIYERSLVVVMADHGVSFRPGDGRRRVTRTNFADLASVPLFIKAPGQQAGEVDRSHAKVVDVLPTVADLLGVELPWKTDGVSLRDRAGAGPPRVEVLSHKRAPMAMPFSAFVRQRDEFAAQMHDEFGVGEDSGLYAAGGDRDLIARPLSTLRVGRLSGAKVELDGGQDFQSVTPSGPVLPAFVSGRATGVEPGQKLAIALNGRVAAVTTAFLEEEGVGFTALLSPDVFRRGSNRVDVLAVDGSGAEPALAALGQEAATNYELVDANGEEMVRSSTGHRAALEPGAVAGFIEGVDVLPGGVAVRGWAAVPEEGAAERILVYVGDELVAEAGPTEQRMDVAEQHGARTVKSGFVVSGNTADGTTPEPAAVRVIGVFEDRASVLDGPPE
jgi:hypothetical protein